MSKNAVVEFVVYGTNGSVDVEASKAQFTNRLNGYIETQASLQVEVSRAVHSVFDDAIGASLKSKVLKGFVMGRLTVTPENYDALDLAIDEYVHNNAEFVIVKGPGGGVRRVCDKAE